REEGGTEVDGVGAGVCVGVEDGFSEAVDDGAVGVVGVGVDGKDGEGKPHLQSFDNGGLSLARAGLARITRDHVVSHGLEVAIGLVAPTRERLRRLYGREAV